MAANNIESTDWIELFPKEPLYLFVPRNEALAEEYEATWSLSEIFSPSGDPAPGIVTTHDQFAISWTEEEAVSKVEHLLATNSEEDVRVLWGVRSKRDWQYDRAKRELAGGLWKDRVGKILYRPFDTRITVFDRNVAVHCRERVMKHMMAESNLGLCVGRAGKAVGPEMWNIAFVTQDPTDQNIFRRGGHCLFPVYIYYPVEPESGSELNRVPNLDKDFIDAICATVDMKFVPDGLGDLTSTLGPEAVLYYIYAVLYSPEYRGRYADFLKDDFPRIPLANNRDLFALLVGFGQRLVNLHLMRDEDESKDQPSFPCEGSNRVDKIGYVPPSSGVEGRVWINCDQYFEGVDSKIWRFPIGGNHPAEKWLKDRKERTLSYADILDYRRIIASLVETCHIMVQIDKTIEDHGGWPLRS